MNGRRDNHLATMMLAYWNNQSALAQIHGRFEMQEVHHLKAGFKVFDALREQVELAEQLIAQLPVRADIGAMSPTGTP